MSKHLTGMDEIAEHTGLQIVTLIELKTYYDLPLEKDGNAIWHTTTRDLKKWLVENGVESWDKLSITKLRALKLRKLRQGPGKIIQGDMDFVCNKLDIASGTLISLIQRSDCPIQKIEDTNQYRVDLNRWEDFRENIRQEPSMRGLWYR
ncbi:MAG: hypothetical protein A4E63_02725 [Syntrophorhabdus sp. PtaU1.Bin050]|nr:MAG: hypothetical protein A4E63_02725 [Syntrophorhabdus sp. PtaU1.Bin050]